MSNKALQAFHEVYPFAAQAGIDKLYKFMSFNPEYLEQILVGSRLYHALPQQFNDPFECKPHWYWPENVAEVRGLRKEFYSIAKRQGVPNKEAEKYASKSMSNRRETEKALKKIIIQNYQKIRVCSFSTSNTNILLWSHYANSHEGLCIAFDANALPFAACLKVNYQDEYPYLEFPMPGDARGFKPALTKSSSWTYEDEYRSILYPNAEDQLPNDGEAYFFDPESITDIYLGSEASTKNEEFVSSLIHKSKIKPNLWKAAVSENTYSINFTQAASDA
jgi:hypothetical protein